MTALSGTFTPWILWFLPLLLGSPALFLIRKVRTSTALRVAAGTIVAGSYLILLFIAVLVVMLSGLDRGTNDSVIKRDQMFAGITFPKGSKVSTTISDGKLSTIVLSKDTDIDGIPAGKGTTVGFGPNGKVGYLTTGRAWIYRGILIPAGSTAFLNAPQPKHTGNPTIPEHQFSGIYQIVVAQPSTDVIHVEDMTVRGVATLRFDGDQLTAVLGHYEWNGEHYKSYRVGVDGEIQRIRE